MTCAGDNFKADDKLLSMTLFTMSDDKVVASVNLADKSCMTSGAFSSCTVDDRDLSKTRLRTLVPDLQEGETRPYGCNVTVFVAGGRINIKSWSVSVRRLSKYLLSIRRRLSARDNGGSLWQVMGW